MKDKKKSKEHLSEVDEKIYKKISTQLRNRTNKEEIVTY